MPVTPTYPGVYIEEVPSGVRTITGVATAITAFIGRAPRGPVDEPVRVQSFGDFDRAFGGLSPDSPMSYAVQHFFLNGGTDAIVVRCYRPDATATPQDGIATAVAAAHTSARGTLTMSVNPSDGDTITIGSRTYAFRANLTNTVDGEIHIAATLPSTQANVIGAINLSGVAGVDYSTATTRHADVTAARAWVNNRLVLVARQAGTGGNALALASTFTNAANRFDGTSMGSTTLGRNGTMVAAQGTLSLTTQPTDGDTITIGTKTYTFQDTLTNVDGNVEIAGGIGGTRTNLVNAINLTGTPGTGYAAATTANTDVDASLPGTPASAIVLTALTAGPAGNAIVTTSANAANPFDGSTLGTTTSGSEDPIRAMTFAAPDPGGWANHLRIHVSHDVRDPTDLHAFNLRIEEIDPGLPAGSPPLRSEQFFNVSVDSTSPFFVDDVLSARSELVRVRTTSTEQPAETAAGGLVLSGGGDGLALDDNALSDPNLQGDKRGIWALEKADLFNILCIPPLTFTTDVGPTTRDAALQYCKHRRAFYIVDAPSAWTSVTTATTGVNALNLRDENAAVYFPRIRMADPLQDNRLRSFAACGVVAGLYARTDARRGVWKAPAGTEATMTGVRELALSLTDGENGRLNPLGVNCLRTFNVIGNVVWGARTLEGADQLASEWKYVPVRRTALFIEETLYRALQWVVFEPNDEPLWAQIRLNVGSFMHTLFRQGAFQGSSPKDAYLVKCDGETTTQADIDRGVVNILVGFAPLKPAEFVFVKIQQLAGQLQT